MTAIWVALMVGLCPSDGVNPAECECPQCVADCDEEAAVYRLLEIS